MNQLPWKLIQTFTAVASAGSFLKAAKELNTSQPTLSRQLAMLEEKLSVTLFDRSTQGLKITTAGQKLIESCNTMGEGAEQFARIASGATMSMTGTVRITANEVIGLYYLPSIIAEFNQVHPEIYIEVDISNQQTSLHKRDADIALRMFRPTQPDLKARRLQDIHLNFVASKDYLSRRSLPTDINALNQHIFIGHDRNLDFLQALEDQQWPVSEKDFYFRTDFLPLQIELARSGAGITITHANLLQQWPELEVILPDIAIPPLEFWLVCHADVQHNQKMRAVMDFLSDRLNKKLKRVSSNRT